MCRISIVTSVYNTPREYLQKYLESVLKQTFEDFEVIIVDDASTNEDTVSFLKNIQNKKVKILFQDKNRGISVSRNMALREAKGEFVCVLDSDDYYQTDFLETMIEPAKRDKDIDMIICDGYTCVDMEGNIQGMIPEKSYKDIFAYCQKPTGCRLMRRSVLLDNEIQFPEGKIYEDNVFGILVTLCAAKIVTVDSYGYINRQHSKSYSHGSLYKELSLDRIPYQYILEKICKTLCQIKCDKWKKTAALGETLNILGTCILIFARETDKEEKRKIIRGNSKFIKQNIKNYIFYIFLWSKRGHSDRKNKILQTGYCLSVFAHCDKLYVNIFHKLFEMIK